MRAPPGAKPAAELAQEVTAMVKITDLDLATHTVSFTDADGLAQTITVQDPEMQDFVETLKVGDEVAVTYAEALAISVEPASSVTGRQRTGRTIGGGPDHGGYRRQPARRRAALGRPRRMVGVIQSPREDLLARVLRLMP